MYGNCKIVLDVAFRNWKVISKAEYMILVPLENFQRMKVNVQFE